MSNERQVALLSASNPVISRLVSVRGIVDPVGAAGAFGGVAPNYPSVVGLGQGFVFMFGCLMLLIILTSWLCMPFIVWGDLVVRRLVNR